MRTPQELEADFDLLIEEFDRATRGLWPRPYREPNDVPAYCVAEIIIFPQRETRH